MTQYNLEPSPPSGRPSRSFIVGIVLVLLFLVVVIGLSFASDIELAFGPTATATATAAPRQTPTPDFGATRVAQDRAIQEAAKVPVTATPVGGDPSAAVDLESQPPLLFDSPMSGESGGDPAQQAPTADTTGTGAAGATPSALSPAESPLPEPENAVNFPLAPADIAPVANSPLLPASESSPNSVRLPMAPADTIAVAISALPTPLPTLPVNDASAPSPLPPTVTPTHTATLTPTPTPPLSSDPLPSATPTTYLVDYLVAQVIADDIERRPGPITRTSHPDGETWRTDREVRVINRSPSGEWVYAEQEGDSGWLRQFQVDFRQIDLPNDPPEGASWDDVRLLAVKSDPNSLPPPPTPIPPGDYPLLLRDRANQARVDLIPRPPYSLPWPRGYYETLTPFVSAVVLTGDLVVAANADGHIYGVSKSSGTQKLKERLLGGPTDALAMQESTIYTVDDAGNVYAIAGSGSLWRTNAEMTPTGGLTIADNRLFVTGKSSDGAQLAMIRMSDGEIVDTFTVPSDDFFLPTIGDQLIYLAGSRLWALDLYHERDAPEDDEVFQPWQALWSTPSNTPINPSAPPIYVSPGIRAAAELYVGSEDGRVYLLDANTGRQLEQYDGDRAIKSMAIDDTLLYTTESLDENRDRLRVYDRESRDFLWQNDLNGRVASGPIVDGRAVLFFLNNGQIEVVDVAERTSIAIEPVSSGLSGGAVSGQSLFSASPDNRIYAREGSK